MNRQVKGVRKLLKGCIVVNQEIEKQKKQLETMFFNSILVSKRNVLRGVSKNRAYQDCLHKIFNVMRDLGFTQEQFLELKAKAEREAS